MKFQEEKNRSVRWSPAVAQVRPEQVGKGRKKGSLGNKMEGQLLSVFGMKRYFLILTILVGSLGMAFGEKEAKKLLVLKTLAEVEKLDAKVSEVEVTYSLAMGRKRFIPLMKALAKKEQVKHLKLILPNSSHVKNEHLEVLREFTHLENFTLNDSRDFGGDAILEQTMAMPKLKKVAFGFN